MAFIENSQDYISDNSPENEMISAVARRDGAASMVDAVLEWAPAGVEGPNDED